MAVGRFIRKWNHRFLGADAAAVAVVAIAVAIIGNVPQLDMLFDGLSEGTGRISTRLRQLSRGL